MSTRAIEALIEKMEERASRETLGTAMTLAARAELEAIRKAAKVAVDASADLLTHDRHEEYRSGMETLQAIAKENT